MPPLYDISPPISGPLGPNASPRNSSVPWDFPAPRYNMPWVGPNASGLASGPFPQGGPNYGIPTTPNYGLPPRGGLQPQGQGPPPRLSGPFAPQPQGPSVPGNGPYSSQIGPQFALFRFLQQLIAQMPQQGYGPAQAGPRYGPY